MSDLNLLLIHIPPLFNQENHTHIKSLFIEVCPVQDRQQLIKKTVTTSVKEL